MQCATAETPTRRRAIGVNVPSGYPPRDLLRQDRMRNFRERLVAVILGAAAVTGVVTTLGIILSLAGETILFFRQVSIVDFLTQTEWTPLFSVQRFGIWPLVSATLLTSAIALVIAVPLGLLAATYLSELDRKSTRLNSSH